MRTPKIVVPVEARVTDVHVHSHVEGRERDAEMRAFENTFGLFGEIERRTFRHSVGETRQAGTSSTGANDGSLQIVGHAAVFGKPSVEMRSQLGPFVEFIDPHAFDDVLRSNPDVLLTWDHDSRYILGRTSNGSLDLSIDGTGLRYWSRVAPTSYASDLKVLMEGDYLNQSSFLFRVAKGGEEWSVFEDEQGNETVQRTITGVSDLFDVCVCAAGAYRETDSGIARSLAYDYAARAGFISVPKEIPFAQLTEDADERTARNAMTMLNWSLLPEADRRSAYRELVPTYLKFADEAPAFRTRDEILEAIKAATAEYRALGDVAWGPEEGVDDLMCDLECLLNANDCCWDFSIVDVAVSLDKAIVCDWADYTFWVVPFSLDAEGDPVLSDMTEWVQVETAWVTTTEGYEVNIRSARTRREARMAEETAPTPEIVEESTPPEVTLETPEVEAVPAVEAEASPDEEAEAASAAARKMQLLAEGRARLARAKTLS